MSSPTAALALGDLEQELAATRRCLERVPDAQWDWRPHEKSWTLGSLATHIARIPSWPTLALTQDSLDLATLPKQVPGPADRAELMTLFDENVAALRRALSDADEAVLRRPWSLRMGGQVLATIPTHASVRQWGISHLIHHRGQLTVYLRLAGVAVPGLYGPSADER